MDSILPICDTYRKNERVFCILVFYEKKPLSFILDSFSFSRHLYFKNMCQTGEFWDLKIRAQRWIRFFQSVIPVGKLREVIFIWHVRNKKLWAFCKTILQSLIITILKWFLFLVNRLFWWLRAPWNFGLSCQKYAFGGLETVLKPCLATETYFLIFLSGSSSLRL